MSQTMPGAQAAPEPMARSGSAVPGPTVLVVEDDPTINQAVCDRLRAEGFGVRAAYDGPAAVAAFAAEQPDLVVLDLMLPGFDGYEVCRRVQAIAPVPVLMLTARADETDIIVGLAAGADDYLTKPFSMRELVARCRALLRRVERAAVLATAAPRHLEFGRIRIDRATRRVGVGEEQVHLTPTEFDLLWALAETPGTVRAREDLLREVWGWSESYGSRTLDTHIRALRSKLGDSSIRTVHGVGYALEVSG